MSTHPLAQNNEQFEGYTVFTLNFNGVPIKFVTFKDAQHIVKMIKKSYGGCSYCYGKGYSTTMGSEEADHTPILNIAYCGCERGEQLKKVRQGYANQNILSFLYGNILKYKRFNSLEKRRFRQYIWEVITGKIKNG